MSSRQTTYKWPYTVWGTLHNNFTLSSNVGDLKIVNAHLWKKELSMFYVVLFKYTINGVDWYDIVECVGL